MEGWCLLIFDDFFLFELTIFLINDYLGVIIFFFFFCVRIINRYVLKCFVRVRNKFKRVEKCLFNE